MDRAAAINLLQRLHAAQGAFYAGGEEAPVRALLTDGTAVVGGVQRRWSTVGLYQVRAGQVAACWLLPLDPNLFDDIWAGSR